MRPESCVMNRPLRVVVIFLALLTALAAQASWVLDVPDAAPVVAGLVSGLALLLGLVFRGGRPGFTRAERQRIFGRLSD
jgi:hypothetical protein